ncbi:hypothetical protein RJT34_27354 [Clitoria ternatea]|uniref:Uncharacterized protein n=1 Tax=Clitoria ternatea TaxID=43366 RepID=A0AAN9F7S6_CLITE
MVKHKRAQNHLLVLVSIKHNIYLNKIQNFIICQITVRINKKKNTTPNQRQPNQTKPRENLSGCLVFKPSSFLLFFSLSINFLTSKTKTLFSL